MHPCEANSRFVQAHAQRGILSSPSLWWLASEIRVHKINNQHLQMGSMLGDLPSFDPHNFSQLRPSDPSNPSKMTPTTYRPTHSRTLPPPDQVITTDAKNILVRNIYQHAKEKLRPKRAASEYPTPEHGSKQLKPSISY